MIPATEEAIQASYELGFLAAAADLYLGGNNFCTAVRLLSDYRDGKLYAKDVAVLKKEALARGVPATQLVLPLEALATSEEIRRQSVILEAIIMAIREDAEK